MTITIDPSLLPLGATQQWLETVQAAEFCCQCTGECGSGHRKSKGRCGNELTEHSNVRLYAVPATPGSPNFIALCSVCLDKRETLARKAANDAAKALAAQTPSLFDLLGDTEQT